MRWCRLYRPGATNSILAWGGGKISDVNHGKSEYRYQWRRQGGGMGAMAPPFRPAAQMAPQLAPTRLMPFYRGNMN